VLRLEPAAELKSPPVVSAVAVHPEGKTLAIAGDDHSIRIFDLGAGRFVHRLVGHSDWVRTLVFSPTGEILASAGNDGRIAFWNVAAGGKRTEARLPHAVTAVVFSQDGKTLAAIGFGDQLHVLDVDSGQPVSAWNCPCRDMRALAYCGTRRTWAGGGRNGIIRIWGADGQVVQEYTAHHRRIWGLAFSPDGRYLASCAEDGKTRVSRLDGQEDFTLESPGSKVMSLAFCGPDQLATGGSDNLIRIWDLNGRAEIAQLSGHTGSVVALAYSGDVLVSAGFDTTVRVWRKRDNLAEDPRRPGDRVGARKE
jgi:WD40 repeat protein